MLHHILVKWNESVENKAEFKQRAERAFAGVTDIPGVFTCEFISSCSDRDNRYDLMIRMRMETEALTTYDQSTLHRNWKKDFTQYIAQKAIFDCDE